jgi:HEAT repeat protein
LHPIVVSELVNALDDDGEHADVPGLAEEALLAIGESATDQLAAAMSNQRTRRQQRWRLARVLGLLDDERALDVLIEAIRSERAPGVDAYIEAVVRLGSAAVPALIQALEGSDQHRNLGLIAALAGIGEPAVEPLIEAIAGHRPEVRNAAVHALQAVGPVAIDHLIHAVLYDQRYQVRRRAIEVLGHIGDSRVTSALLDALNDQDAGVQNNAIRYLGDLGDANAIPALTNIVRSNRQISLRRGAITSLGAIGDVRAAPILLQAIQEPLLREAASSALQTLGPDVVELLIRTLHSPETLPEVRDMVWPILDYLGANARPEDADLQGLAATYTLMHRPEISTEEILSLLHEHDWWAHGKEMYLSLHTTYAFSTLTSLEQISRSADQLAWVPDTSRWLRLHVKDLVWNLHDVIESINLYYSLTIQSQRGALLGARDALLSAIDRLDQARALVDALLPFEQRIIEPVIDQWNELLLEAIHQLRGRASLEISILTPRLPVRETQVVTTAIFSLFNRGDSAARNLSVIVRSDDLEGNAVQIVHRERMHLEPLGIGERREIEIPIAPRGVQRSALVLEARYADDERQEVTERFSCHVEFYAAPSNYQPIERSPYVVGMPVKTSDMFFGRQDVFDWVRENITNQHQMQALVLYGERRMGKTSVLYQLLEHPPTPEHVCILFDLQLFAYTDSAGELLYELAWAMNMRLSGYGLALEEPEREAFDENGYRAFLSYCDTLDRQLGSHRLVIMMDEFGVLMTKVRTGELDRNIFDYLRGVTQRSNRITFLFTGAYEIRRMQQDFESILFNMPKVYKISYLNESDATRLIEQPVQGLLSYHPVVVQKIRSITACHPYFVQYICDELVHLARKERRNYVELTDLDYVIRDVVQDATGNIENSIYNHLSQEEKLVVAALAHVTDDVRVYVTLGEVLATLHRRDFDIDRNAVIQALKALSERDLVKEMRIGQQLRYSFGMGLVRLWLRQNEILLRLGQEHIS